MFFGYLVYCIRLRSKSVFRPKIDYRNYCSTYSLGVQVAEVEVEMEMGKVKRMGVVAIHDGGRTIEPMLIERQVNYRVSIGISFALSEIFEIERNKF